jgi:metal-responsive CopG/Arc/MetJ family transcriptional regulator
MVRMTLDDGLVKLVDLAARKLHTNRLAFVRLAFKEALRNLKTQHSEDRHRWGLPGLSYYQGGVRDLGKGTGLGWRMTRVNI